MVRMASRARLIAILLAGAVGLLACANQAGMARPTAQPDLRVIPAPTQNVGATATAFAQRIVATPTPIGLYIVKAGDTLSKIANTFQTTVDEIMTVNNLADPNNIKVGQRLTIPSLRPTATAADAPPGDATSVAPDAAATPGPTLASP